MLFHCRLSLRNSVKSVSRYVRRTASTTSNQFDPCTGCEIPCSEHVPYPPEILAKIDQGPLSNTVEKYRRHLCIGQSTLPSQWPKDVKNLAGGYLQELSRVFTDNKDAIGYSVNLTAASTPSTTNSEQMADWYLFPDQLKLKNIRIEQIRDIVEKVFINNPSIMKRKSVEEDNLSVHLPQDIHCEKLSGLWILVCCHYQRDERCGVIGPILFDEIEKHVQKSNQTGHIHCLKISHIGGHRFAGNIIVYPAGAWYGRVLTCHIPLLLDAYTSSSKDLHEKLKPLLRGYIDRS